MFLVTASFSPDLATLWLPGQFALQVARLCCPLESLLIVRLQYLSFYHHSTGKN